MTVPLAGEDVRVGQEIVDHYMVARFLAEEAELLDAHRYRDWLNLMTDDITYKMPVRVTMARGAPEPAMGGMVHFDEDRYSLSKRVERLETDHAWTEDPASRTRRFVTNVQARRLDGETIEARSYLLLFRSRGDLRPPEFVSAQRGDELVQRDGAFRIQKRDIVVDEAVLRTQNLAVFL